MSSKLHLGRLIMCCLSVTLPAGAQLDSSALRVKFGSPVNKEVFHIPSGFDLVVDYGVGNQVCRLEVPGLMPSKETVSNALVMRQRMYEFLSELIPGSMRGKLLNQGAASTGGHSVEFTEYEHITISQQWSNHQPFDNNPIVVTFKNDSCRMPSGQ